MKPEIARQILQRPKFGDPQCIAARDRLRDIEKEIPLRAKLRNKLICRKCGAVSRVQPCWQCGERAEEIHDALLDSWTLDILESALEELTDDKRTPEVPHA